MLICRVSTAAAAGGMFRLHPQNHDCDWRDWLLIIFFIYALDNSTLSISDDSLTFIILFFSAWAPPVHYFLIHPINADSWYYVFAKMEISCAHLDISTLQKVHTLSLSGYSFLGLAVMLILAFFIYLPWNRLHLSYISSLQYVRIVSCCFLFCLVHSRTKPVY